MNQCKICFSYSVNPHCNGRDGSDSDLCDVCYYRKRLTLARTALESLLQDNIDRRWGVGGGSTAAMESAKEALTLTAPKP